MTIESPGILIVGAGACGSLVVKELAERGFSVVVLEAGRRFDPANDLQNTEANAAKIYVDRAARLHGQRRHRSEGWRRRGRRYTRVTGRCAAISSGRFSDLLD